MKPSRFPSIDEQTTEELNRIGLKNSIVKTQGCHPRHFERILSSGNWFLFPRDFLRIMSVEQAVLLAHLINFSNLLKASLLKDGWFYCTAKKLHHDLGMSPKTQSRVLRLLANSAFIELVKKGLPAKRHIRINFIALETRLASIDYEPSDEEYLVGTERERLDATETSRHKKDIEEERLRKTHSASRNGVSKTGPSRFSEKASALLYRKLEQEGKLTRGHSPKSEGPKHFDKLLKKLNGDKKRIKRVLLGYIKHFGVQYVPEAYSARKFCDTTDRTDQIFFRIERRIDDLEGRVKKQEEEVIS